MIPHEIQEILEKDPQIGRIKLANMTGISMSDARAYCMIFKRGLSDKGDKRDNNEPLFLDKKLAEKKEKPTEGKRFIDTLIRQLKSEKSIIKTTPYTNPFTGKQKEDAVLLLSDIHIGRVNKFLNLNIGKTEETYNTKIFLKEAEILVHSIHHVIDLLSPTFQISKLWIFGLGDIIDNDLIFRGQRFFIDSSSGEQLWQGVKALTDIFKALLEIFKEIEVINVIGNHGRFTFQREASPVANNFDYHIMKILEVAFVNEDRIKFNLPDSWFAYPKIGNFQYLLHHGDTVYSWMALPYYGIVRKSKARRNEIPFDIETIGHFHMKMEIPLSSQSFTLVNGGWIPKDDYSWKQYGVIVVPRQSFFGVSKKRARTWSFDLTLTS